MAIAVAIANNIQSFVKSQSVHPPLSKNSKSFNVDIVLIINITSSHTEYTNN